MRIVQFLLAGLLVCCAMGDDAGVETPGSPKLTVSISGPAEPLAGAMVTMVATVSDAQARSIEYDWQITAPQGEQLDLGASERAKKEISFTVKKAGHYQVTCTALVEGVSGALVATGGVTVLSGRELPYQVQIIPPASSGLPPAAVSVNVGVDDLGGLTWQVPSGRLITLEVRNADGELVPAIVHLSPIDSAGALSRQIDLSGGSGDVVVSGVFNTIIIPKDGITAPQQLVAQVASALDSQWKVQLKPGTTISGTIYRGATPLSNAAVGVRIGGVPSTISTTDAQGNFSVLSTEQGVPTLIVTPPTDSGLPVAVLNDAQLEVKGTTTNWKFSFAELQAVSISGFVKQSDQTTPAAGARLIFSAESISGVGELVTDELTSVATGRFRRELISDAQGVWGVGTDAFDLPAAGKYKVDIYPGRLAPASEGHHLQELDVNQASTGLELTLQRKALLTGTVVSHDQRAVSAQVLFDGTNAQLRAVTDETGAFSVEVDDHQTYGLHIRPISAQANLAPLLVSAVVVSGDRDLSQYTLPQGVSVSGAIKTVQGLAVANSVIRIWCANSECPSQEIVDQATSSADGSFQLWVPRQ